jgi:poly(3-hydroxybutyrate) depolymerase
VRRLYRVHKGRIFAAGFSAGGCLAAVLGMRHPKLFAGVFVHSGAPCGAASGPLAAINVMKNGANTRYEEIGRDARARAPLGALPVPLLAVHGARDAVVAEINAVQLARQYLSLNGRDVAQVPRTELPAADGHTRMDLPGGRTVETTDYRDGDRVVVRLVRVPQLDHSWSGGSSDFPYNDPSPPDASALLGDFVERGLR